MVLARYGNGITYMRGSVAGQTHKRDSSGEHIIACNLRKHQPTPAQKLRRNAFIIARNQWKNLDSTPANIQLWEQFAYRHPQLNKVGERIILTPYQQYLRFNIIRAFNGLALISTPPEG